MVERHVGQSYYIKFLIRSSKAQEIKEKEMFIYYTFPQS